MILQSLNSITVDKKFEHNYCGFFFFFFFFFTISVSYFQYCCDQLGGTGMNVKSITEFHCRAQWREKNSLQQCLGKKSVALRFLPRH